MNSTRYFLAPVEVIDRKFSTRQLSRAMVSPNSIYRIFEESESVRSAFLQGRIFSVKIDGELVQGTLLREAGKDGTYYNLRLIHLEDVSRDRFQQILLKRGFASPWKREFPRIPISPLYEKAETPVRILLPRLTGTTLASAVNFSYHGMFFEFTSSRLSVTEQVGQAIKFQILTSRGKTLPDISARISRIYDEVISPGKLVRGLGVKFLLMTKDSRRRYDEMILDVCQAVSKES